MNEISKKLVNAVKNDLTPSLGVTEPGAIAYAAACAARALGGEVKSVIVRLNSGIYKNSFTCAVPGTDGMGCALAAALGAIAGDPDKKLMATEGAGQKDIMKAKELVRLGKARAELAAISPEIRIEAEVETGSGSACAVIEGRHDRLVSLTVNGKETLLAAEAEGVCEEGFKVSSVSFDDILDCVETAEDLSFAAEAVEMNLALFKEGRKAGLMPLTEARRGSEASVKDRADLYTCGAIEARVRGANAPAMAITGSGSHGILCTLPVHEAALFYGVPDEERLRALLLSMLVTTYIKENSGLLSTACGCVLAGGTGAALGITYFLSLGKDRDTLKTRLSDALNSMAASVTGMICHGGNTGCSLKASAGVSMAFAAAEMAVNGAGAESVHGILGPTPEETMRNMGRVARDMLPVEKTILEIMSCKEGENLLKYEQEQRSEAAMEYVTFGNTGIEVSRVGFGGIPIQRIDAEGTAKLFEKLLERGVNYIDTARGYTVSEEYIGYAVEKLGCRDKLFLATKSMAAAREAFAKDIETSLNNLRTDHIDLYQIHNPSMEKLDTILAPGGALEALLEAKEAGKIGHIGLTAHSTAVFERALGLDFIESIMFPYNIVETQGAELVKRCAECGKAFIAMKPLAGGAIEDGTAAMRYLLTDPSVTVVIPGMYLESEIEENTSLTSEPLTDEEKERIANIRATLTGNFCRRCNYCAPCTVGIQIPSVFLFEGYLERYGLEDWARGRYAALPVKASECIKCGVCETRCPYELPIRDMLERAAEAFGE